MRTIFTLFSLCFSIATFSQNHPSSTLNVAVGPDHQLMLKNQYKFYAASWFFLGEILKESNISLRPHSMPWARAKTKVLNGELDGLFLAANFEGRNKWAELSVPLGFDYFGHFSKTTSNLKQEVIGVVRLGKHDKIHNDLTTQKYIEVTTAQHGLSLLAKDKVSKFTMSQGYGNYLLANELNQYQSLIDFNLENAEKKSSHLAVSSNHQQKLHILKAINTAIERGIKQGRYDFYMNKYQVPCSNRVVCNL